jgi:ABC-2 type transport system ATP-binding protein
VETLVRSSRQGVERSVEASGLVKSFGSGARVVRAVDGVDVSIARGETVALLGPNGAGKSTTIDLLLGLLEPDEGKASLFGRPPQDAVRAGRIGSMLQTGSLIRDLDVRELVEMMASIYPHPLDAHDALHQAGIEELANRRTQTLSGGETQRVRFALALLSDPDLLVLDEPTVGMDVEARRAFWMTMRQGAAHGRTVLFATHYMDEADAYADRAILMAHGKVVAAAPTTEIKGLVGTRTIRATLPDADEDDLAALEGVAQVERRGDVVVLSCSDSDRAIRALLERFPETRDIEIVGAGLEEAFVLLTGDGNGAS